MTGRRPAATLNDVTVYYFIKKLCIVGGWKSHNNIAQTTTDPKPFHFVVVSCIVEECENLKGTIYTGGATHE